MDAFKSKWEESYLRRENFIFYPKDEYVKFMNRFIRKRTGVDSFVDILDFKKQGGIRALDYGCGIGRQTCMMKEFGVEAYGVDISETAVAQARRLSEHLGLPCDFRAVDGCRIPFDDGFFDFTISEAVLDSMTFETARAVMKEISRVTVKLCFFSVISGDNGKHGREYCGEEIVKDIHEKDTVQSYFNYGKIERMIEDTGFDIKWCRLMTEQSALDAYKYGRYYVVLEK